MYTHKDRKLLDEVREFMRLHHYSIHTERTYCDWIKKFVHFHRMKSRQDLSNGEKKIEAFLTHLAVRGNVSASTQNQAMNALVFLYKKVLKLPLDDEINAVRAKKKVNVPVVMTREETAKVISLMSGTPQLVAKLLYGSGLRRCFISISSNAICIPSTRLASIILTTAPSSLSTQSSNLPNPYVGLGMLTPSI